MGRKHSVEFVYWTSIYYAGFGSDISHSPTMTVIQNNALPLSHPPREREFLVDREEIDLKGHRRNRCCQRQRRYTLFCLLRKITEWMKGAVRIGDYCISNVVMNIVGPTLILIVFGLCYILVSSFWNVFYPWLGRFKDLHAAFVAFVILQVLFNYAMCVTTSNSSKTEKFSRVARKLASATPDYTYPETPQQVEQAKRDYLATIAARRAQQHQLGNYYSWTLLHPTVECAIQ